MVTRFFTLLAAVLFLGQPVLSQADGVRLENAPDVLRENCGEGSKATKPCQALFLHLPDFYLGLNSLGLADDVLLRADHGVSAEEFFLSALQSLEGRNPGPNTPDEEIALIAPYEAAQALYDNCLASDDPQVINACFAISTTFSCVVKAANQAKALDSDSHEELLEFAKDDFGMSSDELLRTVLALSNGSEVACPIRNSTGNGGKDKAGKKKDSDSEEKPKKQKKSRDEKGGEKKADSVEKGKKKAERGRKKNSDKKRPKKSKKQKQQEPESPDDGSIVEDEEEEKPKKKRKRGRKKRSSRGFF